MMWKMQSKIKDSSLRNFDRYDKSNKSNKKKLEMDDLEEFKGKRNRTTSSIGMTLKHNHSEKFSGKTTTAGQPFLGSLAFASLAADTDEGLSYEKRERGMSGMDEGNFF